MPTSDPRVTLLEARLSVVESKIEDDRVDRTERRQELDKRLESMEGAIQSLTDSLTHYKGVVGGVALAISTISAGLVFVINLLKR